MLTWTLLDHRLENMTTRSLDRCCGTGPDGTPWSAVVKTLQPASLHPAFAEIPEQFRGDVLEDLDWRDEPRLYSSALGREMPAPLRMPAVFGVVTDGPEQVSIWMEDVADVEPWGLGRYRRTAEALGALAGRWSGEAAAAAFDLDGRDIGRLFFGKVCNHDLPLQADDSFWDDPVLRAVTERSHRSDLLRLADAVPRLLGGPLADASTGVCHGDATPDNLREPGDGSIVALDWSYGHVGAIGADLGQLVAGRFESGAAADEDVATVAEVVLTGYLEGLDRVGRTVDREQVRAAFALHLAVRSAFSALRLDHRGDLCDDDRRRLLAPRARLARFAIDLGLQAAG